MQINDAYDYLIHLIYCAIHNVAPQKLPEGITYDAVLKCGIRHDIAGFAYLGLIKAEEKPESEILDKWKQRYLLGIKRNSEQEEARREIIDALHKMGIATLELQGTRVKKYYPSPDLRMMGDIDIIIQKDTLSDAKKIMQELGYECIDLGNYETDGKRNNISAEIRTVFFPGNSRYRNVSTDPFEYATVNDDLTADVPDTVFWTCHLLHSLKHYRGSGIGIRRVLDLYILRPEMAKTADVEYVDKILNENGLEDDVKDLFAVADYWFGGIEPESSIDGVINTIKTAGSQGNIVISIRQKSSGKHFRKLKYFCSLVFPKKAYIYEAYPYCEKHNFHYPLCWIYRAFRILFKKGRIKLALRQIKRIFNAKV